MAARVGANSRPVIAVLFANDGHERTGIRAHSMVELLQSQQRVDFTVGKLSFNIAVVPNANVPVEATLATYAATHPRDSFCVSHQHQTMSIAHRWQHNSSAK